MALWDTLFKKKEKTYAQQNMVIPNHQKEKIGEVMDKNVREKPRRVGQDRKKQTIVYAGDTPEFEIEGVFAVGGIGMIKGTVLHGRIKPKSKIIYNKKKYVIKEIRNGSSVVSALLEGDSGTLFLGDVKKLPFKNGEIVRFS
jgi:hypothetical protein